MIESELFGHERGAFTGAIQQRKGRFELAHTGTIFLDEVGDVPLLIQIKMLRVLQEREFERVGGTRTLRADVRIIAATNKDLSAMTANGAFREDLFYRLNVFPVHVPPLRKRKSDIVQLADFFLERYARVNGGNVRRLSSAVIDMLMSYHWPGNVRAPRPGSPATRSRSTASTRAVTPTEVPSATVPGGGRVPADAHPAWWV